MGLERKSSIRKAPVADVVDVLTSAEKRTETVEQGEASQATVGQAEHPDGGGKRWSRTKASWPWTAER